MHPSYPCAIHKIIKKISISHISISKIPEYKIMVHITTNCLQVWTIQREYHKSKESPATRISISYAQCYHQHLCPYWALKMNPLQLEVAYVVPPLPHYALPYVPTETVISLLGSSVPFVLVEPLTHNVSSNTTSPHVRQ